MDLEDEFPSAPLRYTFDDSDDEGHEEQVKVDQVELHTTQPLPTEAITLVVGLHAGQQYLHAVSAPETAQINTKPADADKKPVEVGKLYTTKDTVYAALNAVDMAQAHALAKLLMDQLRINKVVLLDSYVPSEYTSLEWNAQEEPPFIRWLHTSGAQQVPNVPHYEPPNLVRDLAAAIIGKCEIYGIECHALFSLQESLLGKHIVTADTCAAYATACGKLGMAVPLNDTKLKEILKHGGVDEHHHRLYL